MIHIDFFNKNKKIDPKDFQSSMHITLLEIKKEEKNNIFIVEGFYPFEKEADLEEKIKLELDTKAILFKKDEYGIIEIIAEGSLCKEPVKSESGLITLFFNSETKDLVIVSDDTEIITKDITDYVFENSINQTSENVPLKITACLHVEWIQKNEGMMDISSQVAASFPSGKVNSLNSNLKIQNIESKKTGYTLIDMRFEKFTPDSTGILDMYSTQTPEIKLGSQSISLKKYWFKSIWKFFWNYEQKRSEKIYFELPVYNSFSEYVTNFEEVPENVDFSLKLTNLEELEGFKNNFSSFFKKEVGRIAFSQAMEQIKNASIKKYQSQIVFEVPFSVGMRLKIGEKVKICNKTLYLQGCITSINLKINGSNQSCQIKIKHTPEWLLHWINTEYVLEEVREISEFEGVSEQVFDSGNLLEEVIVENDAEVQFSKIVGCSDKSSIAQILQENATKISVKLKNLKTKRCAHQDLWGILKTLF